MIRPLLFLLALLAGTPAYAQGTLPIALQQQFSFTGCTGSNSCGTPLSGGLLYFYQVGTVNSPQQSFQDTGLTIQNAWPLQLDSQGRVPFFYLANGAVHVRLTDSNGVVQFDVPSALVIGPSGGSGGSGVDPTAIAATGDVKFRQTGEILNGWVRLNGQTIGSSGCGGCSGPTGTVVNNLYVYLWNNCTNAHCAVVGGRGANASADFGANKPLTLPDWRGRGPVGLDDMGNTAAGRIAANNISSGGGDGVTTPGATGGEANHSLQLAELAAHTHAGLISDPGHSHGYSDPGHVHGAFIFDPGHAHTFPTNANAGIGYAAAGTSGLGNQFNAPTNPIGTGVRVWDGGTLDQVANHGIGITISGAGTGASFQDGLGHVNVTQNCSTCAGTGHNVMDPLVLGSWYMKE